MLKKVVLSFVLLSGFSFGYENFKVDKSLNNVNVNKNDPFVKKEINSLKYLLFINDLFSPAQFKTILPINNVNDFRLLKFKKVLPLLLSSTFGKEIKLDSLNNKLNIKNLKNFETFKIESLEGLPEMVNIVKDLAKIILLSQVDWDKDNITVKKQLNKAKLLFKLFNNRLNYEYSILLKALQEPQYAAKILFNSGIIDKNNKIKDNFIYSTLPYLTNGKYTKFNDYVYFRKFQDEFVYTYFPGNFDSGKNVIRKYFYILLNHPKNTKNFQKKFYFKSFIMNDFYSVKYRWGFKSLPKFLILNLFKFQKISPNYNNFLKNKLAQIVANYQYYAVKKFQIDLKKEVRVTKKRPYLKSDIVKTIASNYNNILNLIHYSKDLNYQYSLQKIHEDLNLLLK